MALATTASATPMSTAMAAPVMMPMPSGGASAATMNATFTGPSVASGMPWEADAPTGDEVAIGIDLGCSRIRAAIWSGDDGAAVPIPLGDDGAFELPCCVTYLKSDKVLVGDAALATSNATTTPLIGVQRLLGRKFSHLGGAQYLDKESKEFIGAQLEPNGGEVRLKLTFARAPPSGLKKRGASDSTSVSKAARPATVEREYAPEQMLYKLLLHVRQCAEEQTGGVEVTHATIVVPPHWGLAQRRAAHDCALLAGLTPLAVLSQPVALVHAGLSPDLMRDDGPACQLSINWGAGAFTASLLHRTHGGT